MHDDEGKAIIIVEWYLARGFFVWVLLVLPMNRLGAQNNFQFQDTLGDNENNDFSGVTYCC